ncbi:MAG TPA: GDSL-type esterase/lipase family protein [Planctomycetota bacterium]|nr:GDSL-type esterase/lipase family protein [Planctomycetota bacterium]
MKTAALIAVLGLFGPASERLVFLGDSITDGHTLPLLVRQALGDQAPVCINAGVAGDTAAGMRKRLERDVVPRRPTRVLLSVGINDVLRGVSVADYEADVAAISERLKQDRIPLILLTPTILGPRHEAAETRSDEYVLALRRLAEKERYPVADVRQRMREHRQSGPELLEPDQIHLTFEGYRLMARAVLESLGHADAGIAKELHPEPMAGLLPRWTIRPLGRDAWKDLILPQSGAAAHWWVDQERRRGFAVELDKDFGGEKRFEATALLESPVARDVFLNTGADLQSVTLNGVLRWKNEGWTGWHAGKERLPARLIAGSNRIRIETGTSFFLSVTDENNW